MPIKVEVATIATGEKKVYTFEKEDFPQVKRWNHTATRKVLDELNAAFAPPNFSWKFVSKIP